MKSYWLSFYVFDICKVYTCTLLTWALVEMFNMKYQCFNYVLLVYPFALVPYAYCHSYIFNRETSATTFTIYQNLLLGGFGSITVFALRMIESTALYGDRLMWLMRVINPNFCVCDAIIWSASSDFMPRARDIIRYQISIKYPDQYDLIPSTLYRWEPMLAASLGGDVMVLCCLAIFWTGAFIFIES